MTMTSMDNLDDGSSSVVCVHLVLVVNLFVYALDAMELHDSRRECLCQFSPDFCLQSIHFFLSNGMKHKTLPSF